MKTMKIKFEAKLDYQEQAIRSIADLFKGQEICQTNFTVAPVDQGDQMVLLDQSSGVGNRLKLLPEDMLTNLHEIQTRNGLRLCPDLGELNFTVDMETGTGKGYILLRSALELNKLYGFTKFLVVVPSIAIKEGTLKTLQITQEHFRSIYDNVRYNFCEYSSKNLSEVRNFATSDCIEFMVINIQAFNKKDIAVIHQHRDGMMGAKPIDFIAQTSPIVFIDEPQSVLGKNSKKAADAIASLNPLCTFQFSATLREKHHPIFKLDSVDAYQQKLVKQIEVVGITVENNDNQAYVKLLKVENRKGPVYAEIEFGKRVKGAIRREKIKVKKGADLCELSGYRDVYEGYQIADIYCGEDQEQITFTGSSEVVKLGHAINEVNQDDYKRIQIRRTIHEHLLKEMRLTAKGLKVLSLFFIDKVANYRSYDGDGNPVKGKYALMFEEEYAAAIRSGKYDDLFKDVDLETAADGVHNGYFAIDKKKDSSGEGRFKESKGDGNTVSDGSAYELIMKDKEKLLSFSSALKFIFSHSALREGWDNPNVFQICTLNETTSVMKKRQEIGRGLRISVNQAGDRVRDDGVNVLTIMANESYDDFARTLQKEIEDDTGMKFGFVGTDLFVAVRVKTEDGSTSPLGDAGSKALWEHLKAEGYITQTGKVTDDLKAALKTNTVNLPDEREAEAPQILALLKKVAGDLPIRNAAQRTRVNLRKEWRLAEDFEELWDEIKHRTTFSVEFDVEALIEECAAAIQEGVTVSKAEYRVSVAEVGIDRGGVTATAKRQGTETLDQQSMRPPDILGVLQNETNLTRRSLVAILQKADNLGAFKRNPTKYIELVTKIIRAKMQAFIVDGIKYDRLGNDVYYDQTLFESQELFGYLKQNMLPMGEKCVYDHVVYDSAVEREFAHDLNKNEDVKVFAKLPSWFKIDTPLGSYNPDWAVLVHGNATNGERLFFVVETKGEAGALFDEALRGTEAAKIECGKAHFAALGTKAGFTVQNKFDKFIGGLA